MIHMGKIITIGREFGSGGREVGKRLSDELGIAYYDNEIITEIAKRTELAEGYVQHVMENGKMCEISLDEESSGTRKLLSCLGTINRCLEEGLSLIHI